MKKPILNQWERFDIRQDTLAGAMLKVRLACFKLKRELYKDYGFVGLIVYNKLMKTKITK